MTFQPLVPGDTIGIVAPASSVTEDQMQPAMRWLESFGYAVKLGKSVGARDRFLAGADADRARDLTDMFRDDSVKAILIGRGGYGSSRLLELVDWSSIAAHPKPFVGFSDTTAFQLALYAKTGMVSYTGLSLSTDVREGTPDQTLNRDLIDLLAGRRMQDVEGLAGEDASGKLIGGCLSLLVHLLGTPWLPRLDKRLLFLEDVGESLYRVDRMLNQLLLSGILKTVSAVLIGTFYGCEGDAEDGTVTEVVEDFKGRCPCPVIEGLPFGHGLPRRVLPIGREAQVSGGRLRIV
ncbi:MAG TPA: LD-carboxypeptidase [Candidatus Latescibacteria bacterium]|nr:LD-carboxypeptidase [Candidatus Latescibacterota bacterium]